MNQVLLRSELLARLGTRGRLDAAVRDGTWERVLRGAYAPGPGPADLRTRSEAAARRLPAYALVSDRCLLWLLGVDVLPAGPPVLECVVPRGTVVPVRTGVRAREALVGPGDRMLLDGTLPVLRPARAVADLLRTLPLAEAVVIADAAQHAELCGGAALSAELELHAGLRGVRQARRALELSTPLAESPQETRLRVLLVLSGLRPTAQHDVRTADGRWLARVDLAFPDARLAIEYDGREVHLRSEVFSRDRQRQNDLVAAGWTVLRYTAEDLRQRPLQVVAEVRAALASQAA